MTARAKKPAKAGSRPAKREKALPTLDVDPTNEAAIASVAEALVAALLSAAAASARRPTTKVKGPAKKTRAPAKKAKPAPRKARRG